MHFWAVWYIHSTKIRKLPSCPIWSHLQTFLLGNVGQQLVLIDHCVIHSSGLIKVAHYSLSHESPAWFTYMFGSLSYWARLVQQWPNFWLTACSSFLFQHTHQAQQCIIEHATLYLSITIEAQTWLDVFSKLVLIFLVISELWCKLVGYFRLEATTWLLRFWFFVEMVLANPYNILHS